MELKKRLRFGFERQELLRPITSKRGPFGIKTQLGQIEIWPHKNIHRLVECFGLPLGRVRKE